MNAHDAAPAFPESAPPISRAFLREGVCDRSTDQPMINRLISP
jgi:hypothetical protein